MLPSQTSRDPSRHRFMHRRHRRAWLLVLGPIVLIAAALALGFWLTGADPETTPVQPVAETTDDPDRPEESEDLSSAPPMLTSPGSFEQVERPGAAPATVEPPGEPAMADSGTPAGGRTAGPVETAGRGEEPPLAPAQPRPQPAAATPPPVTIAATPPAAPRRTYSPTNPRSRQRLAIGRDLVANNQPVKAREVLTDALGAAGGLSETDQAEARQLLAEVNQRLVFSPEVVENDPFTFAYVIQSGDSLARIARSLSLQVDWRLLKRINRIPDERLIRPGQRIKIITGPFHAAIDKDAFRLDLYLGDPPDRVYVCSYPVGLGEYDSTPTGLFRVRRSSKLINPEWVDPRDRVKYAPDDPANPIGERWIGLEGIDEATRAMSGYGIHGTIEPESIGRLQSMGCVRMHHEDVVVVYEMLMEEVSTVEIRP